MEQFKSKEFQELYDSLWRTVLTNATFPGKNKTERLQSEAENNFIKSLYNKMHVIEDRLETKVGKSYE